MTTARLAAFLAESCRTEPMAEVMLDRLVGLVDPDVGIIRLLQEERDYFPDEVSFVAYRAELAASGGLTDGGYPKTVAEGGRALTHGEAMTCAVFEAYERYCLSVYRERDFVLASYAELTLRGTRALNPLDLVGRHWQGDAATLVDQPIRWTSSTCARTAEQVWVPAQLVYLPYRFADGEPVLRDPLTTGAAAGLNPGAATLRGLMEVVERDAVMMLHYLRLPSTPIPVQRAKDPELRAMVREIESLGLRIQLRRVAAGIRASVVVCRITDPSGVGPAHSLGSKCAKDQWSAAKGAILEAATFRRALRLRSDRVRKIAEHYLPDLSTIDCLEARSFVWAQPELTNRMDYLDDLAENPIDSDAQSDWHSVESFITDVQSVGGDILVKDVTTPEVSELGISVVKVLVPGLQPMHLSEQYPTWTDRLLSFGDGSPRRPADLNPVPHPFL
ncbi:YcaO-like family protein [Streptomyces sp. NPDC059445]|uniref:YcaO-like family protein n=1 Tax=Streptomyces sp. NPDC059445 TaxID=3346832 RepID=UPI0036B56FAD